MHLVNGFFSCCWWSETPMAKNDRNRFVFTMEIDFPTNLYQHFTCDGRNYLFSNGFAPNGSHYDCWLLVNVTTAEIQLLGSSQPISAIIHTNRLNLVWFECFSKKRTQIPITFISKTITFRKKNKKYLNLEFVIEKRTSNKFNFKKRFSFELASLNRSSIYQFSTDNNLILSCEYWNLRHVSFTTSIDWFNQIW